MTFVNGSREPFGGLRGAHHSLGSTVLEQFYKILSQFYKMRIRSKKIPKTTFNSIHIAGIT